MRKTVYRVIIASLIIIVFFISCKKEASCEGCKDGNKPPIVVAGSDQLVTLPTDSISLDGSVSNDPDGTISAWLWTKISGPVSFNIMNATSAKTDVKNLVAGFYQFELKATDTEGLFSKDTVKVTIASVCACKEIIFADLRLISQCYDPKPGVCWINGDGPSYGVNIKDTANILADPANAILGVWIKMDTSNVWEQVPANCWKYPDPYPQTNFTYCLTPDGVSIFSWFYSWEDMEGRKAEVKIGFK